MWAYGVNLLGAEDADAAEVESWEGDFQTDQQAHEAARRAHGPDGDIIVAWVDRLTYSALFPAADGLLADMKERIAVDGGDTTCVDNLSPADVQRLEDELRAVVQVWEEELEESAEAPKRSQAVRVTHRKRFAPIP